MSCLPAIGKQLDNAAAIRSNLHELVNHLRRRISDQGGAKPLDLGELASDQIPDEA